MTSIRVHKTEAGKTIGALLHGRLRLPWPEVRRLLQARRVRLEGRPCNDPNHRLRPGQRLEVAAERVNERRPERGERKHRRKAAQPTTRPDIRIVYADPHIIVVDKPAGLTTVRHDHEAAEFGVRGRRFLPATLVDILPSLLHKGAGRAPERIRAVHRLDRDTSGLVILARNAEAERHLGRQFRAHSIERKYFALVRGRTQPGRIETFLIPDRGDGRRGSSPQAGAGQRAVTHVRLVEELGNFSLVECRLETGRTHQVRIHLGEQGTPLCGERIYDRPLHGRPLPDTSGAKRPLLHAAYLEVDHPVFEKRMKWSAPLPRDMQRWLQRLRTSEG